MARAREGAVLRDIRILFDEGATSGLTDGQLLEQFATRRGEGAELAFTALVERHGTMVLRTCRAILRHEHDSQDAFQATFLILVRRAKALWVRDSLGPWLHRVACRVAVRARLLAQRRRDREWSGTEPGERATSETDHNALWEALHEEIDRLAERDRVLIVLCDLEGYTYEQAARQLGCPVGTVKSRLARGRQRLRDRLTRRGLAPSAGSLGAGIPALSRRTELPSTLVQCTTRAAVWLVSNRGPASASVAALVRETSRAMTMTRLGKTVFAGIALGLVALGGGAILPTRGQQLSIDDVAGQKPRSDAPRSDLDRIQGTWVRVSTDGRKADRLVTMVVKGPAGRPKALVPAGAGEFIFEWKTEGHEGSSSNRVLLDPTRNPRTLDFFPEQDAAPEVCPGIYKLEDDTLTICFRIITGERPTEFVSGKHSEILDVYRRARP